MREVTALFAGSPTVRGRLIIALGLVLAGCGVDDGRASATAQTTEATVVDRPVQRVPLSLYIVLDESDEADDSDRQNANAGSRSSRRTVDEVTDIAEQVNTIWAQADIVFEPVVVRELVLPRDVLEAIVLSGDTDRFFDQVGRAFDVPDPGAVNGFYVSEAFGVNGFTPFGSRVFFVVDRPTVNDERVSSHELGHIFGLHHEPDDRGRLMYSGTNGTVLTRQEQQVARYGVQGVLG